MPSARKPRDTQNLIALPRRGLSLDFANTLGWRGSVPAETLHRLQDVLDWLVAAKGMPDRAASLVQKALSADDAAAKVFARTIESRENIYRLMHAVAAGDAPAHDDLRGLNQALGETPPRVELGYGGDNFGWRIEAKPNAASIIAPVLWSAADILAGPDRARVRECANPQCLWLFLDDSKNGTRRWCSMQACGNRAKAHRHYLRRKEHSGGA